MLKINIAQRPTFTAQVEVHLTTVQRFKVVFEVLEDAEMDALTRQHAQPDPDAPWSAEGDKALLRRAWIGWSDVVDDETKQQVEFDGVIREHLLSIIPVRAAVTRAYFEGLAGGGPRRKN